MRPRSPVRLPRVGPDRTTRAHGDAIRRLVHLGGRPCVLEASQPQPGRVRLAAHAADEATARAGLERARFWTAVDDDLTPFLERFAHDALIGASLRAAPHARPFRRPMPFDVLAAAVCEQLVTDERARELKRALVAAHGRQHAPTGLRDWPGPAELARCAPAELERCGLAPRRAVTLVRVAREVAARRVDLLAPAERHVEGWRRLRAIPGIGPWTVSMLVLHGQGHHDAVPAGDHAYRSLVGEALGGRPGAHAEEADVVAFLEPYRPWRGYAGWHLLRLGPPAVRGLLAAS